MDTDKAVPTDQLQRLLKENEELTWVAKPEKKPLYLGNAIQSVIVGVFLMFFFGVGIVPATLFGGAYLQDTLGLTSAITIIGTILGLLVCMVVGGIIWNIKQRYKHAEYAVTNKRLIQFGGIIGRDYSSVSWDRIQDLEVNVGMFDKFFDTGSINVHVAGGTTTGPGGGGVKFKYVDKPYEALQTIQEAQPSD